MKEYTIRELSKMFDLPASTIRYYEDEGILTNVGRTSSRAARFHGRPCQPPPDYLLF